MQKKDLIIIILIVSWTIFLFTLIALEKNKVYLCETKKEIAKSSYNLLSSDIAFKEAEDSNKINKVYTLQYAELRNKINNTIKGKEGRYSIYFEDLVSGAWIGINEREKFVPASLLKVPIMAAILKKIENTDLNLESKIQLKNEFKDDSFGELYKTEQEYLTIKELLVYMIKESDNTAANALYSLLDEETIYDSIKGLGLPEDTTKVSTKDYANILKSLYYSTYLNKKSSQLALSLMSETIFHDELEGELPKNVKVAHKLGYFYTIADEYFYHDCGIIYLENNHYILCIMSKNAPENEAREVISRISRLVYEFKYSKIV
jgi:beta-lactamase class A